MRAVIAPDPGGPDALVLADLPDPQAGDGDVVLDMRATAVNRADTLQRQGFYPPPPGASDVLGLECSGRISALISFYALPELYAYVATQYAAVPFNTTLRLSLVELFSVPFVIAPNLQRTEIEKWRHRITLSDATDVPHVASALANQCDGIITFDHHFRQVSNVIAVYTPDEYLAMLESAP